LLDVEETPRAFALFRPTPAAALSLAYLTDSAVRLVRAPEDRRAWRAAPSEIVFELEHGSGIAAGDVNGDGLTDLVVASGGVMRVLPAELRP
jgi:hypothetical protein